MIMILSKIVVATKIINDLNNNSVIDKPIRLKKITDRKKVNIPSLNTILFISSYFLI